MELAGKKVLVVGLGLSGAAAVCFLHERGSRIGVTDLKAREELSEVLEQLSDVPMEQYLGGHPIEPFLGAELIVLSPGVPFSLPLLQEARRHGVPVIAEVELASRFLKDRLIGITGSNGKSTTTALTAFILQKAGIDALACGNIGSPLIDQVATTRPERILVIELSSFQLETIDRFKPNIACLLNVTPDHLDRYRHFDDYKRAKLRLFANQEPSDYAVVNADEELAEEVSASTRAAITLFGREKPLTDGVCVDSGLIVWMRGGDRTPILPVSEMNIRGPHNQSNAAAATAMALLCGCRPDAIAAGLREFKPLEHRLEPVAEIDGVLFVNDSKATNVGSTAVALQSFGRPLIVVLGGRDKEGDFTALGQLVRRHVKRILLIGEAAPKIANALAGSAPMERCATMEEAVQAGLKAAAEGDVVLLAPGCASFDMYNNFEHRGRVFKEAVRRLKNAAL